VGVGGKDSQICFALQHSQRVLGKVGGDQVFKEHRRDLVRSLIVNDAIGGDRAAKRRLWIGRQRLAQRVGDRITQAQAAQVTVFDDGDSRRGEVRDSLPGQI